MKKTKLHFLLIAAASLPLLCVSCLKGEADTYEEWRDRNDAYIAEIDTKEYELVVPEWAPQNSVYIKWHNDRKLTANNLVAMSNSTVDMKYDAEDIEGNRIDTSYTVSTGDSLYRSRPNQNIVGMWIAMTTMHVGDSATVIIPYPSAYGSSMTSKMKPYTNMIFHIKIKGIPAYEKPNN